MCAQKVGALRIVIGRYGYKSSFGANKAHWPADSEKGVRNQKLHRRKIIEKLGVLYFY